MFEERLKGFEAKYHHDQEVMFRVHARRDKLFGLWAASLLGQTGAAADRYAAGLVTDFEPHRELAVLHKVEDDLRHADPPVSASAVRRAFDRALATAQQEIAAEIG